MKRTVAAVAVGVFVTLPAAPVTGQAVWEESALPGGVEFRLRNAEGAVIVLQCVNQGVRARFTFAEPLQAPERVWLRAVPGDQLPVRVTAVGEHTVQVEDPRGVHFVLRTLRGTLRGTVRIVVRAPDRQASFAIFGSEATVHDCMRQMDVYGLPRPGINLSGGTVPGANGRDDDPE